MVKIISDSTCDLSPELIAKYDIDILPLHILLGEDEYEDGKNITPEQIYSWSDENKTTPKTSAPALTDAIELFKPYIDEGREIVCFSISSSMSTSGNVMRIAAEELEAEDCITVIDSANLSTGIGLLVIEAAIMAQNNHTVEEMNASKKYRGKINSAIMTYVKDMEDDLKAARPDRVFITHSGCDRTIVEEVHSYLENLGVFSEILETRAGGVISSHCGPGTLGVLFIQSM